MGQKYRSAIILGISKKSPTSILQLLESKCDTISEISRIRLIGGDLSWDFPKLLTYIISLMYSSLSEHWVMEI